MKHQRQRYTRRRGHQRRTHKSKHHRIRPVWAVLSALLLIWLMFFLLPSSRAAIIISGLMLATLVVITAGLMHHQRDEAASITHPSHYIPTAIRRSVLARDHYKCSECGTNSHLEMDHIIPLSKGGATSVENLQVLCHDCNLRKGNR